MKLSKYFLAVVGVLSGCGGAAYEKNIHGDYWITALDSMEELALMDNSSGYMLNVVSPKVIAYSVSDKCISVIRREPQGSNKEFYIVLLNDSGAPNQSNLVGPLSEEQFTQESVAMCSKKIKFEFIE